MRRLRENQNIRGIAISGFGTEEDRQRSLEAGYGTHLTKPLDFNRLLEAIETGIGTSRPAGGRLTGRTACVEFRQTGALSLIYNAVLTTTERIHGFRANQVPGVRRFQRCRSAGHSLLIPR